MTYTGVCQRCGTTIATAGCHCRCPLCGFLEPFGDCSEVIKPIEPLDKPMQCTYLQDAPFKVPR